jgi:hypothetical protein
MVPMTHERMVRSHMQEGVVELAEEWTHCWYFLTSLLSLCVPRNDAIIDSGNHNDHK